MLNDEEKNEAKKWRLQKEIEGDTKFSFSVETAGWDNLKTLFQESQLKRKQELYYICQLLNKIYSFKTMKDTEQVWIFRNPVYRQYGELQIKEDLWKNMGIDMSPADVNHVLEQIKCSNYCERPDAREFKNIIPMKNGWFNIETNELEAPDPEKFITNKIPIKYNPEADCPKIKSFIADVVKEDAVPIIQEMFGYCLYKDYPLARAFMLVGEGKNGKSTLLELLTIFLGVKNIATPSLHALIYDRFAKSELFGKLANIHADLSASKLNHTGAFKMLTGGDLIRGERKFQKPFQFYNYAKLIYSANELPQSNDTTDAFFRRWEIIEFPYTFTEDPDDGNKNKDANIIEKITTEEELSGLFNWALEGLKRVLKNEKFTHTKNTDIIKNTWLTQTNPLKVFIDTFVEVKQGEYVEKDVFYEKYNDFCSFHSAPTLDKNVVGRKLSKMIPQVRSSRRKIGGNRIYCWENIIIREDCVRDVRDKPYYLRANVEVDSINVYTTNENNPDTLDIMDAKKKGIEKYISTGNEGVKEKIIDFFRENPNSKYFDCVFELSKQNIDEEEQKVFEIFEDLKKKGVIHEPRQGEYRLVNI